MKATLIKHKRMKRIGGLLVIWATVLVFGVACSKPQEVMPTLEAGPVIGVSFDSLVVERWQRDMEIIVAEANERGYQVNVQVANEDLKKQNDQINALIDAKVEALIVLPNDASGLTESLARAQREGIPVIAYDRLIKSPGVDLYVSFDNESIGFQVATRLLMEIMQGGAARDYQGQEEAKNIVIINGDPKDNNAALLNKGFYRGIKNQAPAPVTVIFEVWANGWRERFAEEAMRQAIASGQAIHGVICANDMLAASAIKVLSEHNLAGKIPVVSQDAELSACQRIVAGTQLATVYKPINDLARLAVEKACALAEGIRPETTQTLYNGYQEVPYERLEVILVDLENLEAVIVESGFHAREDVYRFKD